MEAEEPLRKLTSIRFVFTILGNIFIDKTTRFSSKLATVKFLPNISYQISLFVFARKLTLIRFVLYLTF